MPSKYKYSSLREEIKYNVTVRIGSGRIKFTEVGYNMPSVRERVEAQYPCSLVTVDRA